MKNQLIAAIIVVLVIVLGIQAYILFRMNDRLNQLTTPNIAAEKPQPHLLPNVSKPTPPDMNDDFLKDQPWNPYEEMQHMQKEMEQLFSESFSRFHVNSLLGSLSKIPEVDLQEKPDQYLVTVNAPGADESSISVKLEGQQLQITIKTEQAKETNDNQNKDFRYRERFVGEFQRILTLPGPADAAKMKTEYRNGVLTITIPKK